MDTTAIRNEPRYQHFILMYSSVRRATEADYHHILHIGRIAVERSHRDSCSVEDMNIFLEAHYNEAAIKAELRDDKNVYHLIFWNNEPAGFSKIILNAAHPNIRLGPTAQLDRIYLLEAFYDRGLGHQLMGFSIDYARQHSQSGMWLFAWTGNERAIRFYEKEGFRIIGKHRFKVSDTHYNPHHQMLLSWA